MDFFDVIIKPVQVFESENGKENFWKALIPYLILGVLAAFWTALLIGAIILFILSAETSIPKEFTVILTAIKNFGIAIIAISGVAAFTCSILGPAILTYWVFLFAKLFGGKGSYIQLLYFSSLLVIPLYVAGAAGGIIVAIPWIGPLVMAAFLIWSIYLHITALKMAMKFGYDKAILTYFVAVGIPMILIVVLISFALISLFKDAIFSGADI